MTVELVDVSRIDRVGGLSRWYIFRMPPLFWANATLLDATTRHAATAAARDKGRMRVSFPIAPHVVRTGAAASLRPHSTLPVPVRQAQIRSAPQTGEPQE